MTSSICIISTKCLEFDNIHPSIKLTMELEEAGSIPILDTRVTRKVDGKLDATVYRKPTHMDRYLHFNSHHPTHVKKGLVRCLYDRARSITKEASLVPYSGMATRQPSSEQHRRKASPDPKKCKERASLH